MTLLPYYQELCLSSFGLPNPFNFICPVKTTIATTKLQMFDRNSIFDIYLGSGKQFRTDDSKHTLTLLTSETFWAQSTTKDYIRAEHKLHSISKLFISQVIILQVMFLFSLFLFRGHSTREPASNSVTYFILQAYTGTGVSHSQHRKKPGEVLEKMQMNRLKG